MREARHRFDRLTTRGLVLVALLATGLAQGCAARAQIETRELAAASEISPPSALPEDMTLGPGDELEVFVFETPELTRRVRITARGYLPYPLVGDLKVTGLSGDQVREHLERALAEYIKAPKVSVSIVAVRSRRVYVLGEVTKPGVYALESETTSMIEAIGQAGGLTQEAKQQQILLVRGTRERVVVRTVDFKGLVQGGDLRENVQVGSGDIVYVPTSNLANAARQARQIVDILTPILAVQQIFLNFQAGTILWNQMADVLAGKNTTRNATATTTTIIAPGGFIGP
jgi:polysaccharide export outer membrane protein